MSPTPSLMPGYAYELEEHGGTGLRRWKRAPDDDWAIVVIDQEETTGAKLLGERRIDDTRCRVFLARITGAIYAQTAAATGGDY